MIKVLFFGTPVFSVPTLEALYNNPEIQVAAVITQPDKPVGRGGVITPAPINKKLCPCPRHTSVSTDLDQKRVR